MKKKTVLSRDANARGTFTGRACFAFSWRACARPVRTESYGRLAGIVLLVSILATGTDSRIGVGFRLGEHADFQMLFELGPQTETEPIRNADSKRRRDVSILVETIF